MRAVLRSFRARWKLLLGLAARGLLFSFMLMTVGAPGLAWTNTEEFCNSCDELKDNVYAENKGSTHDQNRTGVQVICPDCHVLRQPGPMIMRNMMASLELGGHFVFKSISTKQKFEAKRLRRHRCLDAASG